MDISIRSTATRWLCVAATASALAACQPSGSDAFTFPEGDAAEGRQAFVDLGCISCHTVIGAPSLRDGINKAERTIVLGGEQEQTYSYGDLVTAIINPSHEISQQRLGTMVQQDGETQMRNLNDVMTVTELTDIVTFLEQHYWLKPFDRTDYRSYAPF